MVSACASCDIAPVACLLTCQASAHALRSRQVSNFWKIDGLQSGLVVGGIKARLYFILSLGASVGSAIVVDWSCRMPSIVSVRGVGFRVGRTAFRVSPNVSRLTGPFVDDERHSVGADASSPLTCEAAAVMSSKGF